MTKVNVSLRDLFYGKLFDKIKVSEVFKPKGLEKMPPRPVILSVGSHLDVAFRHGSKLFLIQWCLIHIFLLLKLVAYLATLTHSG